MITLFPVWKDVVLHNHCLQFLWTEKGEGRGGEMGRRDGACNRQGIAKKHHTNSMTLRPKTPSFQIHCITLWAFSILTVMLENDYTVLCLCVRWNNKRLIHSTMGIMKRSSNILMCTCAVTCLTELCDVKTYTSNIPLDYQGFTKWLFLSIFIYDI